MAGIEMLVVILLLAVVGVLAQMGVDTSDSSTDPRRPARPVGLS